MELENFVGRTVVKADGEGDERWGWGPVTLTFDDGSIARFRLDGDELHLDLQNREEQRRAALADQGIREKRRLERLRSLVLRAEEAHMRSILSPQEFQVWMDENRMTVARMNRILTDVWSDPSITDALNDDSPLFAAFRDS